jgi:hypothetical protein
MKTFEKKERLSFFLWKCHGRRQKQFLETSENFIDGDV